MLIINYIATEFSIKLPLFSEDEDLNLNTYFIQVEKAIASQKSWSVDNKSIALGFFSFGKFLMYNDLDIATWPQEKNMSDHYIINALLNDGFKEEKSEIADDEHIDCHVDPKEVFNVVEADSSQVLAVLDVDKNRNLVIQGPPGTGKSQTITNIIAQAIGKGKKVLFVSEKMAALEVVKRRLDNIGLGDACLELHSHKTNKKAVLSELQRVMELGEPKIDESNSEIEKYCNNRKYLNEYCNAVNTPVGNSGVNPYKAYGEVLRIRKIFEKEGIKPLKLQIENITEWSKKDFDRKFAVIKEYKSHLKNMGVPMRHPFWGCKLSAFLPSDQDQLQDKLYELKNALERLKIDVSLLSESLGSKIPANSIEMVQLVTSCERAISAPDLIGINIKASAWTEALGRVLELIDAGSRYCKHHERYDNMLVPEAWKIDAFSLRQSIFPYKDKWWRFLSPQYRRANNQLIGLCKGDSKLSIHEKIELLDAIMECSRLDEVIQHGADLGKSLFNKLCMITMITKGQQLINPIL